MDNPSVRIEAICEPVMNGGIKMMAIGMQMWKGENSHRAFACLLDDSDWQAEGAWGGAYRMCLRELA